MTSRKETCFQVQQPFSEFLASSSSYSPLFLNSSLAPWLNLLPNTQKLDHWVWTPLAFCLQAPTTPALHSRPLPLPLGPANTGKGKSWVFFYSKLIPLPWLPSPLVALRNLTPWVTSSFSGIFNQPFPSLPLFPSHLTSKPVLLLLFPLLMPSSP